MKRKTLIAGLFITGTSLVITAVFGFLWPDLLDQQAGLLGLFGAVFVAVAGLLGGTIREWADNVLGRNDKETQERRQVNIGDATTNVITDYFVQNIIEADSSPEHIAHTPYTIPLPVQDFAGREKEFDELATKIGKGAVVISISGGGGIGKTELARKLAYGMRNEYPDSRLSVDLLGTSKNPVAPEEAMRRLLEPFYPDSKLPDDPDQLRGLYQQTFASRKVLLLLDNAGSASQVRSLVPPPPSAAIITSRQHFSLSEYGLQEPLRLNVLPAKDARKLLRAACSRLDDLQDQEIDELANLCGHLPLALRIVASLLNDRTDLSLTALCNLLADERRRLERLKRDNDEELEIEASLSLSYNLLERGMQKRFRYLALFRAPFVENSAAEIWDIADPDDAYEILSTLVARSLLTSPSLSPFRRVDSKALAFYSLHELTRLYAANILARNPLEAAEVLTRYASHYVNWGHAADAKFQEGGERMLVGLGHFRVIWPHLSNAWEYLVPRQSYWARPEMADDWLCSFPSKCIHVLDLILTSPAEIPILLSAVEASRRLDNKVMEGRNLGNLGNAYFRMGEIHKAIEFYDASLQLGREVKSAADEAAALGNLGNSYLTLAEPQKAQQFYEQALNIGRETGDRKGEGAALHNLGLVFAALGDSSKALSFYEQALSLARAIGNHLAEGHALSSLGSSLVDMDKPEEGMKYLHRALEIARLIGDQYGEESILGNMGNAYSALGEKSTAIQYYEQALSLAIRLGSLGSQGLAFNALGIAYADLGERDKASNYYEQALRVLGSIQSPLTRDIRRQLAEMREPVQVPFHQMPEARLNEFIEGAIKASRAPGLPARKYFEAVSKILRDPNNPPGTQALLRVLQQILIGNKSPDLSSLPERLAKFIQEQLDT